MKSRWALGCLGVVVALVAGCSHAAPKPLSAITLPTATMTAALASSPASAGASTGPANGSASASVTASPTGPPTTSTNLTVDDDVRSALLAAFRATKVAPTSVFTGPNAGSVYYAYLSPTKTFWALARFTLGSGSTTRQQVSMQDGGDGGLFSHAVGQPWKVVGQAGGSGPYPCPGDLDPALLPLWHFSIDQDCSAASGRAARADGDVTFVNDGGSDAPSGTYRGLIDLQEVNLNLTGDIWLDAETVTAGGQPMNAKPLRILDINVTKATKTEYSVGTDAASSHVVEGVYDAAFGKRVTADFTRNDVTFLITVSGGDASRIQEISPTTPTGETSYSEP